VELLPPELELLELEPFDFLFFFDSLTSDSSVSSSSSSCSNDWTGGAVQPIVAAVMLPRTRAAVRVRRLVGLIIGGTPFAACFAASGTLHCTRRTNPVGM
jgi:hypothetical protein